MEWALVNELRTKAEKSGTVGICPGCAGEVRAKCGEIVSWHWAHINADCDPWSEPETEWHRKWKGYFPADWQEVTKPPHRADVAGPDGVLEIQRSGISPAEIREREVFYGRMAWLLNGHDFWENLEWIKAAGDYHEFRWKHARKTWITANRTIFIDTPLGLFKVKNIKDGSWKVICGSFVKASKLSQSLDSSGNTQSSMELILYDAIAAEAKNNLLAKAADLLDLYCKYESLHCVAFPAGYPAVPRWRDYKTEHQFLREANANYVTATYEYYKAEIHALELAVERHKAQKLASEVRRKEIEHERQMLLAMKAAAITVDAAELHTSSAGKRLPGKIDWSQTLSKAGISEPVWEAQP